MNKIIIDTDLIEFCDIWANLNRISEDGVWSDKILYSGVDNLVFIGHGNTNVFQFSSHGVVETNDFSEDPESESGVELFIYLTTTIDTVDIEACYCGYNDPEGCLAAMLASSDQISEVYAWTGKTKYDYAFTGCHIGTTLGSECIRYYMIDGVLYTGTYGNVVEILFWEN